MKFDVVMKRYKLNILTLLWVRFIETKGITAVLQTTSKNFNGGMYLDFYKSIWFQRGTMIDTIVLYMLIAVLLT